MRNWSEVFANKAAGYDYATCEAVIKDCHDTLALQGDKPHTDPYCQKLWAEIDAMRDRQMKLK